MSIFKKLGSALGWARRRLRDVAIVGPLLKGLFGIKDKTMAGRMIDEAQKGDAAATAIEAAIDREKQKGSDSPP
jgi:hypothetical protein